MVGVMNLVQMSRSESSLTLHGYQCNPFFLLLQRINQVVPTTDTVFGSPGANHTAPESRPSIRRAQIVEHFSETP